MRVQEHPTNQPQKNGDKNLIQKTMRSLITNNKKNNTKENRKKDHQKKNQ